jgi:hypothetical protein
MTGLMSIRELLLASFRNHQRLAYFVSRLPRPITSPKLTYFIPSNDTKNDDSSNKKVSICVHTTVQSLLVSRLIPL